MSVVLEVLLMQRARQPPSTKAQRASGPCGLAALPCCGRRPTAPYLVKAALGEQHRRALLGGARSDARDAAAEVRVHLRGVITR